VFEILFQQILLLDHVHIILVLAMGNVIEYYCAYFLVTPSEVVLSTLLSSTKLVTVSMTANVSNSYGLLQT
jgi:hypothetical protein